MQTDPIADFLTRLRNAAAAKHQRVDVPVSKLKTEIARAGDIRPVVGGLGISILTTPKGLMSGRAARKAKVGGEILCEVW
jgi:small subunit ribosomal protein S8